MAELKHFRHLLRAPRADVMVLFTCFFLTVFTDMVIAVVAGMGLAAILFMKRMSDMTRVDILHSITGDDELQSHGIEAHDVPRGVTIYSVDGPFFFGASAKAITAMESVDRGVRVVIMRLNRVPVIDATGLYALEKVFEHLHKHNITLVLSGVRAQPRQTLADAEFIQKIGAENIAPDIEWALARCYEILGSGTASRQAQPTPTPKTANS
jgi:SulP family sulfate permease